MTVEELAITCVEAINSNTRHGLSLHDASILVITPAGWKAPLRFPRGRIARYREDGSHVRYFPAAKVVAWLAAYGAINLTYRSAERRTPAPSSDVSREAVSKVVSED